MLDVQWIFARLLTIALTAAAVQKAPPSAWTAGTRCPYQAVAIRAPKQGDVPFDQGKLLLQDPENANSAPGPGGVLAFVRSDSLHHPHIYLADSAAGTTRMLLAGSAPRWSPDGKKIACTVWKSQKRPWNLIIVDVASGQRVEPDSMLSPTEYRWSPNGRYLAVSGQEYKKGRAVLSWLDLRRRRATTVDTLAVLSDYDFGWSADSELLAFTRPTKLLPEEDVCASDLWIAWDSGRMKCRTIATPDQVERQPRWISSRALRVTTQSWDGSRLGDEATRVIELSGTAHSKSDASGHAHN